MDVGAAFGDAPLEPLAARLSVAVGDRRRVTDLDARPTVRTGDDSHGSLPWKESTTETKHPLQEPQIGLCGTRIDCVKPRPRR